LAKGGGHLKPLARAYGPIDMSRRDQKLIS